MKTLLVLTSNETILLGSISPYKKKYILFPIKLNLEFPFCGSKRDGLSSTKNNKHEVKKKDKLINFNVNFQ